MADLKFTFDSIFFQQNIKLIMSKDKHMIGFEKEEKLNDAFQFLREYCQAIQKRIVLYQLLDKVNPSICVDLFKRRTCERKLKYIGEVDGFFKKRKVYESINFNGGTYAIKGYDRRIGSAYFEIID